FRREDPTMPIRAALPLVAWLLLATPLPAADPNAPRPGGPVYLLQPACGTDLVIASTTLAGAQPDALVLVDSKEATPYLRTFLAGWKPRRLVVVSEDARAGEGV